MLKNEIKLWEILNKYSISKFSFDIQEKDIKSEKWSEFINGNFVEAEPINIEKGSIIYNFLNGTIQKHLLFSEFFTGFATNINRAIAFYPEIIKLNTSKEFFNMKSIASFQTIHILLITALEVYLDDLFRWISQTLLVRNIEERNLDKFIKEFNLKAKFKELSSKNRNLNFFLSEILPNRMDFQQKEKCKSAYKILGIDVTNISDFIWEKIYGQDGYIKKRNEIIHRKIQHYLNVKNIKDFNLDKQIEKIENIILDIVKFVYYIENQRFFKYPAREETNTGQLDNFNYKELDPLIKKVIINNNIDNLFLFADYKYKEGDYKKAIEVLEIISQIRSDIIDVWYNLGLSYEKIKDSVKAQENYRKAYSLDPNYEDLRQKVIK